MGKVRRVFKGDLDASEVLRFELEDEGVQKENN
jgi:hypothetical protein